MIFGGPYEIGDSQRVQDKYSQKAKTPSQTMVHLNDSKPLRGYTLQLDDIIFTHTDTSWVHHPNEDTLINTTESPTALSTDY